MNRQDIAKMIDISAVKTNVSVQEIDEMLECAIENKLLCVFGMPCYVPYIAEKLKDYTDILVGGVVGFPSGAEPTEVKVFQTKWEIEHGADEIDMVINVGYLQSGMYEETLNDIRAVVEAAQGKPVKVILEVGYLTDEEIKKGTEIVVASGASFIKTGTGWSGVPTSLHHIDLINEVNQGRLKMKAAGGVNTPELLEAMVEKGVSRFGLGRASLKKIFEKI